MLNEVQEHILQIVADMKGTGEGAVNIRLSAVLGSLFLPGLICTNRTLPNYPLILRISSNGRSSVFGVSAVDTLIFLIYRLSVSITSLMLISFSLAMRAISSYSYLQRSAP